MIQLIEAGHSYKVFGVQGKLRIQIDEPYVDFVHASRVLFIVVEGNNVPFFIERLEETAEEPLVTFKGVDTPEDARILSNQILYIDRDRYEKSGHVTEEEEEEGIGMELEHYQLIDETSGVRAEIIQIEEFPQQLMVVVQHDGADFFVPVRDEWIIRIDQEQKEIVMRLPHGMFER